MKTPTPEQEMRILQAQRSAWRRVASWLSVLDSAHPRDKELNTVILIQAVRTGKRDIEEIVVDIEKELDE